MKCCGDQFNPNEACGWPKKTVRATIALMVIPPVIMGSIAMMILLFTKQQYESALGILATLTGILGTIVGYYFGSRSAERASEIIREAEHENLENANRQLELLGQQVGYQRGALRQMQDNSFEVDIDEPATPR